MHRKPERLKPTGAEGLENVYEDPMRMPIFLVLYQGTTFSRAAKGSTKIRALAPGLFLQPRIRSGRSISGSYVIAGAEARFSFDSLRPD
jgi:hypothetical protein